MIDGLLEEFRAAPLSQDELLRRAGQLDRFLRLVPIEYGRGVTDGTVTKDFEIQEAITFRDGAASAFRDLESVLIARDARATRELGAIIVALGDALGSASRGTRVASPESVEASTARALELMDGLYPERLEGRREDRRLRRHRRHPRSARGRGRRG